MAFTTVNPATEQVVTNYPLDSEADVERKLTAAAAGFERWRQTPYAERARLMVAAGKLFRERRPNLAALMTAEMGKPIAQAEAEIDKVANACDVFARDSQAMLADDVFETGHKSSRVVYEPMGAVLAIMPWNFPLWQTIRFAGPNLMAGNVAIVKHAPVTTGCGQAMQAVFTDAGFPDGVFGTVIVDTPAVKTIIDHPAVIGVTLTGSERAGRSVAALAGAALKKSVLELGGSDPFIVLADANLDEVIPQAVQARCQNSGQTCIAAKRFIVEEAIADAFERRFSEAIANMKVGDPTDRTVQVGPLARKDLVDALVSQIERSVAAGATLMVGGQRRGPGFFVTPAVLTNVRPGMAAFEEETFGPVAAVVRARDENDLIRLANLSRFGLGASVWTPDTGRAQRIAARLAAGCVFINGIVRSDPRLPFGGVKNSGYGREMSKLGILEFLNAKTIVAD